MWVGGKGDRDGQTGEVGCRQEGMRVREGRRDDGRERTGRG